MRFEELELSSLVPNPRPLTGISPTKVDDLDHKFLPWKCGPLLVSAHSNPGNIVLDGNHRLVVLLRRGIKSWPCEVHDDLTEHEEIALIRARGRDISPYRLLDDFGLEVKDGDAYAQQLMKIFLSRGLTIKDRGSSIDPKIVGGLGTIWKHRVDLEALEVVVGGIINWETSDGDKHKWNSNIVMGLCSIITRPDPKSGLAINVSRLFHKLETVTPSTIVARGAEAYHSKETKSLQKGVELAIFRRYRARGLYG